MAYEVESGKAPKGGEGNLKPDPEGGTASVACEGDPIKSGYHTIDASGMSTTNKRKLLQESESNKASRVELNKLQRKSYKCLKRPEQIIAM